MKRRFFSVFVATMCVGVLAACGTENKSEDGTLENPEVQEELVTEEDEESDLDSEPEEDPVMDGGLGDSFVYSFTKYVEDNPEASAMEIANYLKDTEILDLASDVVEVQAGYLAGFNNTEVTGFSEGAMYLPMIGSIPFVSYVFTVDENMDEFMDVLKENADLRWNICVEADEMKCVSSGNKVFFIMCPHNLEEE